jgi:hypothetical protein
VKLEEANRNLVLMQKAFDVLGLEKKDVYITPEEYLTKMLDSSKEAREKELLERNKPLEKEVARLQKLIDDGNKKLDTLRQAKAQLGFFDWGESRQKNKEISELETKLETLKLEQDIPKKKIEENNELFKDSMNQMLNEMANMSPKEKQDYAYKLVLAMRHQYEEAAKNLDEAKKQQKQAQDQYNQSEQNIKEYQNQIGNLEKAGAKELTAEEKARFQTVSQTYEKNSKWLRENKDLYNKLHGSKGKEAYNNHYYAKEGYKKSILEPQQKLGERIKTAKQQLGEMQNNLTQLKGMNAPEAKQNQPEVKPAAKAMGGIS